VSLHRMITKHTTGAGAVEALWRGTVVEITAGGAWVRIPRLTGDDPVGPLPTVPEVAAGDRVIVAAVEGRTDDLLILAVGG